ncbi:MAG: potassium transporter TrkG [Ilumatobacteraceae bacterium]
MVGASPSSGALPYVITGWIPAFDDAPFESISGFTTTGATVLRPIEGTGPGVLFPVDGRHGRHRARGRVLPTVGSGGDEPAGGRGARADGEADAARPGIPGAGFRAVYVGFTVVLALAYIVAGMSLYDGVAHSFTTVSTGGFSPYNSSLGHFDSAAIEWICIVAMFIAGSSFTLLYRMIRAAPGRCCGRRSSSSTPRSCSVPPLFAVNDAAGSIADRIRCSPP